jgi:hypothetical protein
VMYIANTCMFGELSGRDSSVGIATRYGLDGPGIESRWGRDISHLFIPGLGHTRPLIQGASVNRAILKTS